MIRVTLVSHEFQRMAESYAKFKYHLKHCLAI